MVENDKEEVKVDSTACTWTTLPCIFSVENLSIGEKYAWRFNGAVWSLNLQTFFRQRKELLFSATCRVTSLPLPSRTIFFKFLKIYQVLVKWHIWILTKMYIFSRYCLEIFSPHAQCFSYFCTLFQPKFSAILHYVYLYLLHAHNVSWRKDMLFRWRKLKKLSKKNIMCQQFFLYTDHKNIVFLKIYAWSCHMDL
jgi:hypothetical protein